MGIKLLFSFLSILVGFAMAGWFTQAIAFSHEMGEAFAGDVALIIFYFLLFAGIAIMAIGCYLAISRKRDFILTIALGGIAIFAIIFQIVALILIGDVEVRESGFAMIIFVVANIAIVTLANIYVVLVQRLKSGHESAEKARVLIPNLTDEELADFVKTKNKAEVV